MPYRIKIDRLCTGYAECVGIAPEVFSSAMTMSPSSSILKALTTRSVLDAARACPVDAITVFDISKIRCGRGDQRRPASRPAE